MDVNDILSVCLITYNHEKYVEQAIDSILMQKTSFNWKLVIADDCSTDSTRSILKHYQQKYPEKIHLILQEKNVGPATNFVDLITFPKSKYIAYLEGDDYWMDENKLQKQVGFLEANPDFVLSFHKVKILKPTGELVDDFTTNVPENYETIETLARLGNYIHSPTIVYRNNIVKLPAEYTLSPIGDYFLYMLLAEHGKLNYIKEEMAVYRYGVGVISSMDNYMIACNNVIMYSCMIANASNVNVKQILMNRQIEVVNEFKNTFILKNVIIYKIPLFVIYFKERVNELIVNPNKSLKRLKSKMRKIFNK